MELLRFGSLDQVRQVKADSFLEGVILNTHTHTHMYSKMITAYTFFSFVLFLLLIKVTQTISVLMLLCCHLSSRAEEPISKTQPAQFKVLLCTPPHHFINMKMTGIIHHRATKPLSTHKCCTAAFCCWWGVCRKIKKEM